ncbi:MAG: hypothetical protein ACRCTQ_04605 [Brevinemataceae bacterium]
MGGLTNYEIGKYINNQVQDYNENRKVFINEFLGFKNHMPYLPKNENDLQEYTESRHKNTRINKYIMKWMDNQESFVSYYLFRLYVTDSLGRIKISSPEDSEKI